MTDSDTITMEKLDISGVDLAIKLGARSAERNCGECMEDAAHYLYSDGVFSGFVCPDHLDDAIDEARGGDDA